MRRYRRLVCAALLLAVPLVLSFASPAPESSGVAPAREVKIIGFSSG